MNEYKQIVYLGNKIILETHGRVKQTSILRARKNIKCRVYNSYTTSCIYKTTKSWVRACTKFKIRRYVIDERQHWG